MATGGWYEVVNGSTDKPSDVDTTSSKVYVYVRRNFELAPKAKPSHYRWEEMKIPKEMWEIARLVMEHDNALKNVYAALTEFAASITGKSKREN